MPLPSTRGTPAQGWLLSDTAVDRVEWHLPKTRYNTYSQRTETIMNESVQKPCARRGRIFPERTLSSEELAKRRAENEAYHKRCSAIFDRVRPELIGKYYGWYIAIEPDSGEYLIDENLESAHTKALQKYPNIRHCVFRLSETEAIGRI